EGVGALLAPDPAPATVPAADTPGVPGAADPTQVLPHGAPGVPAYDPNGATSVLPHTGGPAGAADPTTVLPHGAADPTRMMPPMPQGQQGGGPQAQQGQQPEQPHPWQSQLRAARDRNEQTQIQYLDPSEDPLRRRPQRQVARPQQQPQPGYGHPQQQPRYAQPQPQQYAPAPQHRQAQQPQRYAPPAPEPQRPAREPRAPRQRSANPMKIPGLGCLKGCLFTILILFVASWLVWELSPLQEWIGTGKGYWDQLSSWVGEAVGWIKDLGGSGS
ncbi:serine/threonine protein kinase, partial [Streptomyces spiralis]